MIWLLAGGVACVIVALTLSGFAKGWRWPVAVVIVIGLAALGTTLLGRLVA